MLISSKCEQLSSITIEEETGPEGDVTDGV
jgi:hypothetical protein